MGVRTRRRASAFAPAHVTGIFAPSSDARDPRARGSRGAGVVLEVGATAEVEFRPGDSSGLRIVSDATVPLPISREVARRLRPSEPGQLTVRLRHALPIGQGFGMSAAGSAATALAVGAVAGRPQAEALAVAHLADLFGGGGLGGVAAIAAGGGLEFRGREGIPPWGRVRHRPLRGTLVVGVVGGPIPSPSVLRRPAFLRRVTTAARPLDALLDRPSERGFFAASEAFTDALGLAPASLSSVLRGLRRRGAFAAQAMFGRSFFARVAPADRESVLSWLEERRVPAVELGASATGARLLRSDEPAAQPF